MANFCYILISIIASVYSHSQIAMLSRLRLWISGCLASLLLSNPSSLPVFER